MLRPRRGRSSHLKKVTFYGRYAALRQNCDNLRCLVGAFRESFDALLVLGRCFQVVSGPFSWGSPLQMPTVL